MALPPARKLKAHIFVCTNERDAGHPRGSCKHRGSEELVDCFKKSLKDAGMKGDIRAQRAGCLDTCEYGPTVVVYPENVWYGPVSKDDVKEIIDSHIVGGKPVDRLK